MTAATKEALKRRACDEIDRRCDEIAAISEHVMRNPESGYREEKTAAFVSEQLNAMGLQATTGLALTGVKARLTGRRSSPTVGVLGELDSLIDPAHPFADPVTHAAHSCGHNAQIASMLGAGMGLQAVMSELDGDVVLLACPAEECIELNYRLGLREEGRIEFVVGKAELIKAGAFDDVDMVTITHTPSGLDDSLASVGDSHNGCVIKYVHFRGKSSHAGGFPQRGVNALKAAYLGLSAIDAQRETFFEADTVRIHSIITKGGDVVSAVPADVHVEAMIRGRTLEAIEQASEKFDRSMRAGALALGASVEIVTRSGYLPNVQDTNLVALSYANCAAVVGEENMGVGRHSTGSTDVGDVSQIMPAVHPRSGGTKGSPHDSDYWVRDHVLAAVNPAKSMAMTVIDLLQDGAVEAERVTAEAGPKLSREQYLETRRKFDSDEVFGS